ncbi:unannotated protein [freshwater metagenome]|uniref:Unannotated protein n=1 Tax=freshwater metagenome TaxID=449393 RepID=A0A6J7LY12_9ZZZZ
MLEGPRAGIELVDLRHRGVVGVDEPGERAALGMLDRAGEGADSGKVDRPKERPVIRPVHRKLAHPVPRPHDEQQVLLELVIVEHRGVVQDRIGILGDEIDPVLGGPLARPGHGDAAHRRIAISADEDTAIAGE